MFADNIPRIQSKKIYSISEDGVPEKNRPVLWIKDGEVMSGWRCEDKNYPFAFMDEEMFDHADSLEMTTKFNAFAGWKSHELRYAYLDELVICNE